ncbi:MAG TPA: hypothetical protein VMW45_03330, partial [Dehalococcoidia bacterium]|nr:hypothetical protein [Dehalococcoidia bacterium]
KRYGSTIELRRASKSWLEAQLPPSRQTANKLVITINLVCNLTIKKFHGCEMMLRQLAAKIHNTNFGTKIMFMFASIA